MQEIKLIYRSWNRVAHTLSVAFDGVNTKFVATFDGVRKRCKRASCYQNISDSTCKWIWYRFKWTIFLAAPSL